MPEASPPARPKTRRGRWRWLVSVVCLIFAALAMIVAWRTHEQPQTLPLESRVVQLLREIPATNHYVMLGPESCPAARELKRLGPAAAVPLVSCVTNFFQAYVRTSAAPITGVSTRLPPKIERFIPGTYWHAQHNLEKLYDRQTVEANELLRLVATAWGALRMLGPDAAPALSQLLGFRQKTNSFGASETVSTLLHLGPAAAPAGPALVRLLGQSPEDWRFSIVQTLSFIEAEPELVGPLFLECLDDPDPRIHNLGLRGLMYCGPWAAQAQAEVVPLLRSADSQERRNGLKLLIAAGRLREESRPVVRALLKDRSPSVVALAALALCREHPQPGDLQSLVEGSLSGPVDFWPSCFLQMETAHGLGLAGTNAQPFLPALRPLLEHPTNDVRRAVANAIRRVEGSGMNASPVSRFPNR